MVKQYMHDFDNVESIITSLNTSKQNYEDKIMEIKTLINNIETSNLWVDPGIKASFINCCNQYLNLYNKVLSGMTGYIDYLDKKSKAALELETAYTRRA